MGVSQARNRGVVESAAEWILFLDDDVVPSPDALTAYSESIRAAGSDACGFAGPTVFPDICNLRTAAVTMSYLTYFWGLPRTSTVLASTPTVSPPSQSSSGCRNPQAQIAWAVTANLVLRRHPDLRFDPCFPFTGGGEDIAACTYSRNALKKPLLCCPDAVVTHPWWEEGAFSSWRFFSWTQGDGLLLDMFPQHRYLALPNTVELCAFLVSLMLVLAAFVPWSQRAASVSIALLGWMWAAVVIEAACDLYHVLAVDQVAASWTGEWTPRRVAASLLATVFKNHVELGHFWVQAKQGRWWHLCHRFDYFCGLDPVAIAQDSRRKAVVFFLQMSPALLYVALLP